MSEGSVTASAQRGRDDAPRREGLRKHAGLLLDLLRPYRAKAVVMTLLLLMSTACLVALPLVMQRIVDGAAGGASIADLRHLALLLALLGVTRQVAAASATVLGADVAWSTTNDLRTMVYRHALGLDLDWHHDRSGGELVERIDGDVTALSNLFSQFAARMLGAALLLVGIVIALWWIEPWLGLALTVFAVLEIGVLQRTRTVAVPASGLEREAHAELFGFVEERLAGIEDLRANGGGPFAMHAFEGVMHRFFGRVRRAWMLRSVVWLSSYLGFIVGLMITLVFAVIGVTDGTLTLGMGYAAFQYMFLLHDPIEQISQQLQEVQKATAGIARVSEVLATRSSLPDGAGPPLPDGALRVDVDGVSFAYGDVPVLTDVHLHVPPGTVVGLLGRTGSGKSTLVRLLTRLYDVSTGSVSLSGRDVRTVPTADLRRRVAFVPQEVQLVQGTVRDNLTLFGEDVSDARLVEALHGVGLGAWLEASPHGLETPLASSGRDLSAGQAQLLALARAFLRDPGLVILDEPSSRLDPASQALLQRGLDALLRNRTAIVIAHRLETVSNADTIVVLDEGRVAEVGARARLADDPSSRYARLLRASRGSASVDDAWERS